MWFSRKNQQDPMVAELRRDIDQLKRDFHQVQQEWDATSTRVTKMLRRIRMEVAAQEPEDAPDVVDARLASAAGTIPASSGRLAKIKQQLEAAGRKDGE